MTGIHYWNARIQIDNFAKYSLSLIIKRQGVNYLIGVIEVYIYTYIKHTASIEPEGEISPSEQRRDASFRDPSLERGARVCVFREEYKLFNEKTTRVCRELHENEMIAL